MAEPKPPIRALLSWQQDMVFDADCGGGRITIDGDGGAGPSPMQILAIGLAGCMAADLVVILTKGRHPLKGLAVMIEGQRSGAQPARFTRVGLHYTVTGGVPHDAIARAIQLSRDKYCSVWHSLRQDIELDVDFEIIAE